MARPLITVLGASGFVGSAVLTALAERPVSVRAVSRRPAAVPAAGPAEFEVRTADLTDAESLAAAVAGSDAVINLVLDASGWRGADDDSATARVNVDVMRDLVGCLRAGRKERPPVVVSAGSVSQVGPPPRSPIDGTEPDRPQTSYDRQKQSAEGLLKRASHAGTVRGVSLRLPTVFGDGPDRGVLATMARRALAGEALTMWHDGTVERELLYVHDVADAFVAALDHADALAGGHWLLGRGRGERIGDVFRTIADLVSAHTERPPVPVVSVPPPADARRTDFHSVVVDSSAFRSVTGWRPRVPLREALTLMVRALAGSPPQS
ncbi:NAD-dependent epimerase/dehydratase family protein [Streptosporangium sp. NPDC003464]